MPKERLLRRYLKLVDHVRPDVVMLRDGSMLALYEVDGIPVQTLEMPQLRRIRRQLNHNISGLSQHRGIVLFDWTCRGFADPSIYPNGKFITAFAGRADARFKEKLFDRYLFLNRCYRGVLLRPMRIAGEVLTEEWQKTEAATRWFSRRGGEETDGQRVEQLEHICEIIENDLRPYYPKRLGWRLDDMGRLFTEIGEALIFAMTGVWRSVGVQAGRLIGQLFSERLIFGDETIEIRGPAYSEFAACYGGKDLPEIIPPGTLDGFLGANFRSTISNSFRLIPQQTALRLMARDQNRKVSSGDRAKSQIAALDDAMDEVQSGRMGIGDHSMVATVFSDTPRGLHVSMKDAWTILQNAGFQVMRHDEANEGAYVSMLPGNPGYAPNSGATTTFNFASLAPMHTFPKGDERGQWGEPIAMLRTTGGTPYRMHLDLHALGFGETGSGKTSLIAWLLTQSERLNALVNVIDYKRGLEPCIRFLDGAYLDIGNPTGLNFLKGYENTPEDRHQLFRLYRGMIYGEDRYVMTPEEERRLALGIRAIMALAPENRWLGDLRAFLGVSRTGAGARLEKFCYGREFGWICDNPFDVMRLDKRVLGFDLTRHLTDQMVSGPVVSDILYRTNKRATGRRLFRVIDEGWRIGDIPAFEDDTKEHLKVDRKLNARNLFFTQSVSDWRHSSLGKTLREQCSTIFGFAIKRVDREDLRAIKLTERECEIVEELQVGSGVFLFKQGDRSTPLHLPLHGLDDEIAVLSGTELNTQVLDRLREQHGDSDLVRLEELYHQERKKVVA